MDEQKIKKKKREHSHKAKQDSILTIANKKYYSL